MTDKPTIKELAEKAIYAIRTSDGNPIYLDGVSLKFAVGQLIELIRRVVEESKPYDDWIKEALQKVNDRYVAQTVAEKKEKK